MTKITHLNGSQSHTVMYPEHSSIKALRQTLGISQNELAIQCAVTRHSIIRQEQLCYPSPLPSITSALSDITGIPEYSIIEDYKKDVFRNRLHAGEIFASGDELISAALMAASNTSSVHPFVTFRQHICSVRGLATSRIYFSQLFSIHPATLDKYENYGTGFPMPIEVAFAGARLPEQLIRILMTNPCFNRITKSD